MAIQHVSVGGTIHAWPIKVAEEYRDVTGRGDREAVTKTLPPTSGEAVAEAGCLDGVGILFICLEKKHKPSQN